MAFKETFNGSEDIKGMKDIDICGIRNNRWTFSAQYIIHYMLQLYCGTRHVTIHASHDSIQFTILGS